MKRLLLVLAIASILLGTQMPAVAGPFVFDFTGGPDTPTNLGNEKLWFDTTSAVAITIHGYFLSYPPGANPVLDHEDALINHWKTGLGIDNTLDSADRVALNNNLGDTKSLEWLAFDAPAGYYIDTITLVHLEPSEKSYVRSNISPGGYYGSGVVSSILTSPYPVSGTDNGDQNQPYEQDMFLVSLTNDWLLVGPNASNQDSESIFRVAQLTIAPVPEPATMLLLGSGLIGLAGFGRKKLFNK